LSFKMMPPNSPERSDILSTMNNLAVSIEGITQSAKGGRRLPAPTCTSTLHIVQIP
jgi:hypothetical protein